MQVTGNCNLTTLFPALRFINILPTPKKLKTFFVKFKMNWNCVHFMLLSPSACNDFFLKKKTLLVQYFSQEACKCRKNVKRSLIYKKYVLFTCTAYLHFMLYSHGTSQQLAVKGGIIKKWEKFPNRGGGGGGWKKND